MEMAPCCTPMVTSTEVNGSMESKKEEDCKFINSSEHSTKVSGRIMNQMVTVNCYILIILILMVSSETV